MKNTFLKKACAVALAAVMAVTFAPVASLDVFAARTNDNLVTAGTNSGVIGLNANQTGTNVRVPGTYTVHARTDGHVTITLDATDMDAGSYNFEVNGEVTQKNVVFKITGKDKDDTDAIDITITGAPTAKVGQTWIPNVDIDGTNLVNGSDDADGLFDNFSIKLRGNMHLVEKTDVTKYPEIVAGLGSTPLATVGAVKADPDNNVAVRDMYLGNIAISAVQWIEKDPVDVYAWNGAVEVWKLKDGSAAFVHDTVYSHGTSIKAYANDKTALATVQTTINFKYYVVDNGQYSVELPGVYTENAYYSGYSRINAGDKGIQNSPIPCNGQDPSRETIGTFTWAGGRTASAVKVTITPKAANKLLDAADIERIKTYTSGTPWVVRNGEIISRTGTLNWATDYATYDQAITIDMNGDDWKGATLDAYYADSDPRKTKAFVDRTNKDSVRYYNNIFAYGETYYTMDPSAFTKSEDGIAKVDGTKYFVSYAANNELTRVAGPHASKSVDILRGTEVKASAGNDYAYDTFAKISTDLTVTAPADMSLVKETADTVVGRYQDVEYGWRAFGKLRHSGQADLENVYAFPYKDPETKRTTENIYVAQVASGSVMSVYVDPRVKITKADNLGYFETDVFKAQDNAANNIVGADWQKVTFGDVDDVTKAFVSSVTGQKSEANYYASKEIKKVVAGVDPDVVIKGEINADVVDTVNGKNTWDVNTNTAKEKSQVTAHRMYSGREHVYTADPKEIEMLVAAGWKDEGPAFTVNAVASGKGTPIYRLYNKNNGGMHFYTASAAEKDMLLANGWTEGKPVFYGADKATGIPVYRTYNTGSNNGEHNYTTNMAEVEMNVQKGWRAEGVAFYVFK